jgi:hypothetical protein
VIAAMVLVSVGGTFGVCFAATRLEFLASGGVGGRRPVPDPVPAPLAVKARGRSPRPNTHTKN